MFVLENGFAIRAGLAPNPIERVAAARSFGAGDEAALGYPPPLRS
jgi:hypothetical protein